MKGKKINWGLVGLGILIATGTAIDVIPGDEIIGLPLGTALIAKGANII